MPGRLLSGRTECLAFESVSFENEELHMEAQIKLGRILGVEIGLHYTWFLIALLITLSLAGQFRTANPEWGSGVIWTTAVLTGCSFLRK
jgi:hypothetical protein